MIQNMQLFDTTPTDWSNPVSQAPLTRPNRPANGTNRTTQPRAARVAFTATNMDRTSSTHR